MSKKDELKEYSLQRDKIRHGDAFATASPALFSRLIRFFTRAKLSHVGIFLVMKGRIFTVEALEGVGVRIMLASKRFNTEKFVLLRGGKLNEDLVFDTLGDVYDRPGALFAIWFDTKSAQNFCSEGNKNWLTLDFSHLKGGVLPRDIVSALTVI